GPSLTLQAAHAAGGAVALAQMPALVLEVLNRQSCAGAALAVVLVANPAPQVEQAGQLRRQDEQQAVRALAVGVDLRFPLEDGLRCHAEICQPCRKRGEELAPAFSECRALAHADRRRGE